MRKFIRFLKKVSFHPNPNIRFLITLVYCGIGIYVNFFCLQVFCMPVMYAAIMCIAFFIAILVFPFVEVKVLKTILYFLLGMGVPICIYCILFLAGPLLVNYIGFLLEILLLGAGLLAFIPFYLLRHIYLYYRQAAVFDKRSLRAGILLPLIALCIYLFNFHSYLAMADKLQNQSTTTEEFVSKLPNSYFTERILGLHWKYHTRLSYIYDGWRPPLHDPFLIVGLWVNPHRYFYGFPRNSLWPTYNDFRRDAMKYYHRMFPQRPLKVLCPCSYSHDGREYLSNNLDNFDSVVHIHPSSYPLQ